MDIKNYKVSEYLRDLDGYADETLYKRYIISANGSYEPNPKAFQRKLLETLSKKNKNNNYLYPLFARIVAYPCYQTIVNKLYWDVYVLLSNEGLEINLDNLCEDVNAIFKASDFKPDYRQLSFQKTEKEYARLVQIMNKICDELIIKRALANGSTDGGSGDSIN